MYLENHSQTTSRRHQQAFAMTRVTEAAATTLQTWSRKKLAEKELASRRYEAFASSPSKADSTRIIKNFGTQFLLAATVMAVVGAMCLPLTSASASSAASSDPFMMASSPVLPDSSTRKTITGAFTRAIAGSIPTVWALRK